MEEAVQIFNKVNVHYLIELYVFNIKWVPKIDNVPYYLNDQRKYHSSYVLITLASIIRKKALMHFCFLRL